MADLEGDGLVDVVAMGASGQLVAFDGFPAIADLDLDGKPELVVTTPSELRVLDAKTGTLRASTALPGSQPGSPVIAAFAGTDAPDGKSGTTLLSLPASHATWTEFVSVADVDGNGVADMLFSTNDTWGAQPNPPQDIADRICHYTAAEKPSHGVFVYSDPAEKWMRTRRVWNPLGRPEVRRQQQRRRARQRLVPGRRELN